MVKVSLQAGHIGDPSAIFHGNQPSSGVGNKEGMTEQLTI